MIREDQAKFLKGRFLGHLVAEFEGWIFVLLFFNVFVGLMLIFYASS
jgi:hypothetical protein